MLTLYIIILARLMYPKAVVHNAKPHICGL